jgi:Na+:H+ antiporter, NhaA family
MKIKNKINKFFISPIEAFARMEASSGIILAFCAVFAMGVANSKWSTDYFSLLNTSILGLSVLHWVNDGLMAIFFFVIGMEIKKEILIGELSTFKKAALPVAAALGGMVIPALIYFYFNPNQPELNGWGIPMATDIAFALGVLTLFSHRVPLSLKVFLLALAIVDDLGAVLVIALFYTKEIRTEGLLLAAIAFMLIILLRKLSIKSYLFYILVAALAWFGVFYSGVHATVAGVLIGFLTPLSFRVGKDTLETYSPLEDLIHKLHPWVSFGIMPIFAFANAGIAMAEIKFFEIVFNSVHQGVFYGLIVGKPIGIILFSGLAVLFGFAVLPNGLRWAHILGAAFLGGIGFTMALFISGLSLKAEYEIYSKTGIIFSSVIAALMGSVILAYAFKAKNSKGIELSMK